MDLAPWYDSFTASTSPIREGGHGQGSVHRRVQVQQEERALQGLPAQAELAAAVPGSKHIINTDSGHEIHKDQPQLVLDSIREVVEAVRAGKTSLEP
jgi:hypothetical protein